jgi:hypothetical protein
MRIRYNVHSILAFLLFQFAIALDGAADSKADPREWYLGYSDYQIITDTSFRADRYFQTMAEHGVNFQRIWVTGYSDVAVKFEELMPFAQRRGKYRLTKINPQYLKRLSTVMQQAQTHNQQVMLTLFDHWSLARGFAKTPWYYKNNHEKLLQTAFPDFYNLDDKLLMQVQENLVTEIVRTTKRYEPIYEIMNESAGTKCGPLAAWHERVASWILREAPDARIAANVNAECPEILNAEWLDIISFHHLTWQRYGICGTIERFPNKHVIIDTDGAWEVRDDNRLVEDWFAESRRCGASFNHKDDIYTLDRELLRHYRNVREPRQPAANR